MRLRLARRADEDIAHILDETLREFGTRQVSVYANLIDRAIAMVAEAPERPASKARPDLGPDFRSFHVGRAARRMSAASHVLYFVVSDGPDGINEVVVLRVLHDRMEPKLRLAMDMDPEETDESDGPSFKI